MRIIPAIDIIEAKCVRLSQGDYNTKKLYSENPLELAKYFEDCGIKYLHLVDLDGAKDKQIVNHKVLLDIASKTSLKIDFGGGIKSHRDVQIAFESGASQITVGSVAVENPSLFLEWLSSYGPEKIILGADSNQGKIATLGWQQISQEEVIPFIKTYVERGVKYVVCTDISKDGMLSGVSEKLYAKILSDIPKISLIASGGVSSLGDLERLSEMGCEATIIGKALYEGYVKMKDLARFL